MAGCAPDRQVAHPTGTGRTLAAERSVVTAGTGIYISIHVIIGIHRLFTAAVFFATMAIEYKQSTNISRRLLNSFTGNPFNFD